MLILTRKVNEMIQIGPDITIMVTRIDPYSGEVRLGICAPNGVIIVRTELLAKVGNDSQALSTRGVQHLRDH